MSKGAVLIARNNSQIDYVKQSVYLAKQIKKYLNLPVSIITDSVDYLKNSFDSTIFDKIIECTTYNNDHQRAYFDGAMSHKVTDFKNNSRSQVFDLTPYEETLLLDTDYIINNDLLLNCFKSSYDLMMYKDSYDITQVRNAKEFQKVSDYSIDFYWATVVFFRKTAENKIFFDLIQHIQENWNHYRRIYQINSLLFRNDFAFSIAVHIMNGFKSGNFVKPLPGKHYYITDKDILWDKIDEDMVFLIEKKDHVGEYTICKTKKMSIHVMNKFSLQRMIDKEITHE